MPFTTYGKNLILDAIPSPAYISAHSADPGETGVSESSSARENLAFGVATGGSRDSTNAPSITMPPGSSASYCGIWDSPSGGNMIAYKQLTATQDFPTGGTLDITDADLLA